MYREAWPQIAQLARVLSPWVDFVKRRPRVSLVVVSLSVFLWPLCVDVALALIYRLPSRVRWWCGELTLVSILAAGLIRLCHVAPRDSWPGPPSPDESGRDTAVTRWVPWALRLAVASLAVPIMHNPDGLGFADWDFVLDKFEAVRRTILDWGQFPWWHPWCRGGFPLAAEPQIGALSMATPLVLSLGTTVGLRLAAILCLMIAVEGSYRLARLWLGESWSAACAALVYGLNGGVIVNTAQGYVLAMSYCSLPWLAYHTFRLGERCTAGLWLGFWMAFAVLNGIQYLTLYAVVLTAAIWVRAARVQPAGQRLRLLWHTVAACGVFLTLCGWRLMTVLLVLLEDRRERVTEWDESLLAVIYHLLARPLPNWPEVIPGRHWAQHSALTFYVGPVVVLLGLASLAWGWRWWHTLTLACGWLALGSLQWYQPSSWLAIWPFFRSAHVVTRWEFVALLGLGLAAGSVLARWRRSGRWGVRALAATLVFVIAADYITLGYQQFPWAFSVRPEPKFFPGPPVPAIVNVWSGLGYPCVLRGYGVIQGYEPMLSYYRDAPTLRRAREDPEYRGEAWTESGAVQPVFWSPNRILFQVQPGEEVFVNQNPGSWWWVNGRPAFPGRRCAEMTLPFAARADGTGKLELRIHPRGLALGLALHIVGIALLMVSVRFVGSGDQSAIGIGSVTGEV